MIGDDCVDTARFVRSSLHGFVHLELGEAFQIPRSTDLSFSRLVDALDTTLTTW
ncbi:TetR-like C-terminal domain-containing protein [Rhodococcus sp. WAY2]|uniref:TetR-like C-terminal domain-containing protein n=1 Tax=Rhodococcus sp. WAY2 TaxID=2663121 RepID=UPI002E295FDA|nr:TetR-like C-terminal domain-containing protein [Rhodococcus sp. WAY2]